MHAAEQEVPRVGEAPRHVGVDELVDHDPRRDDAQRERELHDHGDRVERRQPCPQRAAAAADPAGYCATGTWPFEPRRPSSVEPRREERRLDAGVGRRLRDRARDLRLDRRRAGRLLERGDVLPGDAVEVVLRRHVGARGLAHARGDAGLGEPLERPRDRRHLLVAADRHLQRDVVGQLREPADVADDERLAERERADRAARRLPHRRRAQLHDRVARRHERPEPLLLDVRLAHDARVVEAEALEAAVEVEAGRLGADEQQPRARMRRAKLARTRAGAAGCACSRSGARSTR